jgi:hypothetical protein
MLLLIGRRRKVIFFFIGISRHIQERISYPSILFSDWLGGVGPRIFVYCVQHVLPGVLLITEGVHP